MTEELDQQSDISHDASNERETLARLARKRTEIEGIFESAADAMALIGTDGRFIRVNSALARMSGRSPADHVGRTIAEVGPKLADWIMEQVHAVEASRQLRRNRRVSALIASDPERNHLFDVDWYPVYEGDRVVAVGMRGIDVTEREEREALLTHVVRELQHRVKNTLANVVALVEQARRSDRDPEVVLDILSNRVRALALTHGRLTEANWQDTGLTELLSQELGNIPGSRQVALSGPEVTLSAQPALALSMAIHELASNSLRYGSLSQPDGRLAVDWNVEDDQLHIRWREIGRPDGEIGRHGFGWRLIETSVGTTLHGSIDAERTDRGYCFDIRLPLRSLQLGRRPSFSSA